MRVFVTGASGFIGSEVTRELLRAGHQVLGLARSDPSAEALVAMGAQAHRGDLEDLQSLRRGAELSEGVIHTAFDHDFSNFVANCDKDRRAIEALGAGLKGSDRPLLITSGVGMGSAALGQPATEDVFARTHPNPRIASELAGASLLDAGINVSVVRLPQVHNTVKQGLVTYLVGVARKKGAAAYVGDGSNRWSAVHVKDAARVYCAALEKHEAGARYHAVSEEGIAMRDIATVIGRGLKVPVVAVSAEQASDHFDLMALFAGLDMSASSALTQIKLGWHPTGPGLIADLERTNFDLQ